MAEEEVVAPEAPAAAEPEEKKEKVLTINDLKKVNKPDEVVLKEKVAEEDEKIAALQARLTAIKESLDSRDNGRGETNSELAAAKAKYNEARAESRRLQQEKRNIYDQISAADELKKQQQDLTQRLRSELSFFSVEEIDRKIKSLEAHQQTSSLSIKEDKKIMEDIKKLAANKPMIKQYDEAQESLKGVREHHNNLYSQLKAKNSELTSFKEEEDKHREEMDGARARDEAKRSDNSGLLKERDSIRGKVNEHRDEIRRLRDEFNKQRGEFLKYQKDVREIKNREYAKYKAERQKEYEEEKKRRDEEEAKRDPWEEEKAICEQLISWVGRYLPKKVEEEKKEDAPIDVPKGAKLHRGKGTNDGEEEDPYAGLIKKKSKRKGGKDAAAPEKPKAMKIALGPEDFAIFEKLGFKAPSTTEDCPKLYDELLEKKEWLKTAPPKKKKPPPAPPPAAEAPAEEAPAPAEGEFDLAAHEKAELEKKQADAAKKAKEKDELEKMNAEKDAALAAAGKRAAGGLHKFDPDEVDVHGGAATADDFMDAFGFGGDDMPAEEDDAAEAEAPAENGSADMISIQS